MLGYTLGHANIQHLFGNLSLMLIIGPIIEEKYGSSKLLVMMGITALVTAILQIFFFREGLLGASGIVFMLILLASFTKTSGGGIPLTFILVLFFYLGNEFTSAFNNDNISQFAHIAGGLFGSIFGFVLKR
jgi:GlpG protein